MEDETTIKISLEDQVLTVVAKKGERGERGEDGQDADEEEIIERVLPVVLEKVPTAEDVAKLIPTPENGKDGLDGKDGIDAIGEKGEKGDKGDKGEDGKDGSPDTAEQVKDKLLSVGIKYDEIQDTPNIPQIVRSIASKTTSLVELDDVDFSSLEQVNGKYVLGSGGIESVVAGTNITVDDTDPDNPIVSSTAPNGSGATNLMTYWSDSDTLASDPSFVVDPTNDRLGVQVTAPQVPLHAASVTGTNINNVVTGSATLIAETLPATPTGSITVIDNPAAGSGGSVSYVDAGAGTAIASANGTSYYFRIYPTLHIASQSLYYRSPNYEEVSATDPNDSQSYNISVSWGGVTIPGETAYYFVEYSIDGSSFYPINTFSSTSEVISSLGGSDATTPWPTFYVSDTAPTPFTYQSSQYINGGSGGLSQIFGNVLIEVDSVKTISSVEYCSGTPATGSFDDSSAGGSYDAEISWTDNGNATNAIARISQDAGSTWYYQYVGSSSSPYVFTSLTNDSSAEARWGQTYSSVTYNFTPHGTGTSASGNAVYSTAGATYSATVSDTYGAILKHSFTGNASGKIIAPQGSPAYGTLYSGSTYYDAGYTSWVTGATVTPQTYGYSGSNQNRDYRIYSYSSTLGIYGTTPLTVSTTSGSGTKYVSLSWTLPSGITQVKVTRQVNGGGYTVGKLVSGSSLIDDTLQAFSDGTTITPTAIVGGTARFDKSLTSLSNEPQLAVVDTTGSGTRYSMIGFGVATNSSSAPTYNARIYAASDNTLGTYIGSTERERANTTGRFFGGTTAATDLVHIAAGTTSVAPIRLTSGSLTTGGNIRAGQIQFLTDKLYATISTGTAVKEITLNDAALTASRVPVTTTNGRLTSSSVTSTELGYVSGVTSAIQTQLNSKGSGTVTSIATTGLISGGTITSTGTITTSIATNRLVGRSTAGTGVMEAITLGTGLSFSGTTLNVSGFVTGATNSTLTLSGTTLGINLANANNWSAIQNFSTVVGLGTTSPRNTNLDIVAPTVSLITGTGTISTSISNDVVTITGTGTSFTTEMKVGDLITDSSGNLRSAITRISSNTTAYALGLAIGFTSGSFKLIRRIASAEDSSAFTSWAESHPSLYNENSGSYNFSAHIFGGGYAMFANRDAPQSGVVFKQSAVDGRMKLKHNDSTANFEFQQGGANITATGLTLGSGCTWAMPITLGAASTGSNETSLYLDRSGTGANQTIYMFTRRYAANNDAPKLQMGANGIDIGRRDGSTWDEGIDDITLSMDKTTGYWQVGSFGTSTPTGASAFFQITGTTEQLRVRYDSSNYYSTTVGSTGGVTFDAVGSGAGFTFSDPVNITSSLQCDSIVNDTGLASGTYTPTLTGVTNVSSSTARLATYMRVGNTVTVSGQIDVTPTANNTRTTIGISLPVASNFSTAYQAGGTGYTIANTTAGHGASIQADATNDRVEMDYYETHGGTDTISYQFTYEVI